MLQGGAKVGKRFNFGSTISMNCSVSSDKQYILLTLEIEIPYLLILKGLFMVIRRRMLLMCKCNNNFVLLRRHQNKINLTKLNLWTNNNEFIKLVHK